MAGIVYFSRPHLIKFVNGKIAMDVSLKIYNNEGAELSIRGDNSDGELDRLSQLNAAVFDVENGGDIIGTEIPILAGSEQLLQVIADHLGYDLVKKPEEVKLVTEEVVNRSLENW